MKSAFFCSVCAFAILSAAPTSAQEAPRTDPVTAGAQPAGNADSEQESQAALGDILVTARRRQERLQDVPLSVTAFTPEKLAEARVVNRTDLANFTPSLISITGGYPGEFAFFALRGQGPAFGSVPGVINYFAEVPAIVGIDGRVGTFYDLSNVQVLAGPQGTLFGKNATGGNILFEPARPTNRHEGYVQLEYGNLRDLRAEFAANIPIVDDRVLLRVAGEVGRRDGYTIDVGPNFRGKDYDNLGYQSIRASLILRPVDGVELYTIARYHHSANNGPGTVLQQLNPALGLPATPASQLLPGFDSALSNQQRWGARRVAYDLDEFTRNEYWQVINHATVSLGEALTLKNIASYSEMTNRYGYDYDATPVSIAGQTSAVGAPNQAPTYFTEELQLQGRLWQDAVNANVGVYYDRLGSRRDEGLIAYQFPISLFVGPVAVTSYNRSRSHAVFGQATIDLGKAGLVDGLSVTGGLRRTWDETSSFARIAILPTVSGEAKFSYTSYNASVDYALAKGVHAYVTARDAFKAGGVNGAVTQLSPLRTFPPEKLEDIEIGLKSQLQIGGVPTRLNLAAFRGNYTNIQRSVLEQVDSVILIVTRTAARGRIQGLELTAGVEPLPGLSLNGSYSYMDARYTQVADATVGAILAGAAFPFTPKNKVTLGASYRRELGHAGTLLLSTNWAYQSRFSTAQNNLAQVAYLPAYDTLALRGGLQGVGGSDLDLTLFMANAADRTFATGLHDLYNVGGGTVTYTYGEPRTYGVQLRYHW